MQPAGDVAALIAQFTLDIAGQIGQQPAIGSKIRLHGPQRRLHCIQPSAMGSCTVVISRRALPRHES